MGVSCVWLVCRAIGDEDGVEVYALGRPHSTYRRIVWMTKA